MADAEAVRVVCTSHLRRDLCACFLLKIRFVVSVERQSTVMYPESVSCAGETVSERPGCDSRRLRTHNTKSHVGAPVAGRDPSPGCRVHSEPYSVFGFVDRDVCQRWLFLCGEFVIVKVDGGVSLQDTLLTASLPWALRLAPVPRHPRGHGSECPCDSTGFLLTCQQSLIHSVPQFLESGVIRAGANCCWARRARLPSEGGAANVPVFVLPRRI